MCTLCVFVHVLTPVLTEYTNKICICCWNKLHSAYLIIKYASWKFGKYRKVQTREKIFSSISLPLYKFIQNQVPTVCEIF